MGFAMGMGGAVLRLADVADTILDRYLAADIYNGASGYRNYPREIHIPLKINVLSDLSETTFCCFSD